MSKRKKLVNTNMLKDKRRKLLDKIDEIKHEVTSIEARIFRIESIRREENRCYECGSKIIDNPAVHMHDGRCAECSRKYK
jgi:uncharacterized protein with PIN domain